MNYDNSHKSKNLDTQERFSESSERFVKSSEIGEEREIGFRTSNKDFLQKNENVSGHKISSELAPPESFADAKTLKKMFLKVVDLVKIKEGELSNLKIRKYINKIIYDSNNIEIEFKYPIVRGFSEDCAVVPPAGRLHRDQAQEGAKINEGQIKKTFNASSINDRQKGGAISPRRIEKGEGAESKISEVYDSNVRCEPQTLTLKLEDDSKNSYDYVVNLDYKNGSINRIGFKQESDDLELIKKNPQNENESEDNIRIFYRG
ncbi:MAG: hypothetical protein GY817_05020 [bacterium]|nr:hypothetical protein [bacterium]